MKDQGKGRLARQLGGKGAFAEVVLELEPSKTLSISFDECDASDRHSEIHYAVAVSFGIRFALEKLTFMERHSQSYHVRVLCIRTMLVDSTESFVAYAAAKAVYAALGRSDEPMETDMERRAIVLATS